MKTSHESTMCTTHLKFLPCSALLLDASKLVHLEVSNAAPSQTPFTNMKILLI